MDRPITLSRPLCLQLLLPWLLPGPPIAAYKLAAPHELLIGGVSSEEDTSGYGKQIKP